MRNLTDSSLYQLTLVRFREFLREPEAVFWSFVFPVLLAAGLGIAFRHRPPEVMRVGVVATATEEAGHEAPPSRELTAALGDSGTGLVAEALDSAAGDLALRTGRVALVVVPRDSSRVEYRYDPTRPDARTARLLADDALQRAAGRRDPVTVAERRVSEPGSRYIDFFIPGLLGMNLMGSGIWGVGYSIVSARNKKLLKRLIATPMSRVEYLMSFLISRLVFLVLEVATLLGFGVLAFGVPARGPLTVLALVSLLGALGFSGLGLLVASRAKTVEGASGLMNLVMMPMWVFSGVFFSAANFPQVLQPFVQALPLTAVNDALRANMLQGAGLGAVAGELAIIAAWTVGSFLAALRLFRWR